MTGEFIQTAQLVIAKSTLLLIAAAAAATLLRSKSASLRAAVWQASLLGAVFLPALSMWLPSWRIAIPVTAGPAISIAAFASGTTKAWGSEKWLPLVWTMGALWMVARIVAGHWTMLRATQVGTMREIVTTGNGQRI